MYDDRISEWGKYAEEENPSAGVFLKESKPYSSGIKEIQRKARKSLND